jgi:colanic acid biosynthesis glycosyl transferase WcaI
VSPKNDMPRILILYHYFYPDNVVSARIFSELCFGLRARGWDVEAAPCNRGHGAVKTFALKENCGGIIINRVWRPPFRQVSGNGRIVNALWMTGAWAWKAVSCRTVPDVVLTGTDPIFGFLSALFWKKFRPKVKLAHWCFDLYPDAAVVDGILRPDSFLLRKLKPIVANAFRSYDFIADLGPCMRERIRAYGEINHALTLTPWALEESPAPLPVDLNERRAIFGTARIGILYSGNFGRAHDFALSLELARRCRHLPLKFAYSVRGNRVRELKAALQADDRNVAIVPFADESKLAARLSSADIHLMSLRPEWSGMVVPSKFFGSLASGRPVIYEGAPDSDVGRWINQLKTGWVLTEQTLAQIAVTLAEFCQGRKKLDDLYPHCHDVYQKYFLKDKIIDDWDGELRRLLNLPAKKAFTKSLLDNLMW